MTKFEEIKPHILATMSNDEMSLQCKQILQTCQYRIIANEVVVRSVGEVHDLMVRRKHTTTLAEHQLPGFNYVLDRLKRFPRIKGILVYDLVTPLGDIVIHIDAETLDWIGCFSIVHNVKQTLSRNFESLASGLSKIVVSNAEVRNGTKLEYFYNQSPWYYGKWFPNLDDVEIKIFTNFRANLFPGLINLECQQENAQTCYVTVCLWENLWHLFLRIDGRREYHTVQSLPLLMGLIEPKVSSTVFHEIQVALSLLPFGELRPTGTVAALIGLVGWQGMASA
jgi:hypothetical protein